MKTTSLLAAFVALPLLLAACSSEPEATTDSSDVVAKCEEDDTKSCSCSSGENGTKTCSSGTWGSCECKAAEATPPPPAEVRPVCTELTSCDALTAPTTFAPAKGLDVKLEATSKDQIRERLRAEVAGGSLRARYLAAALAAPQAGEALDVTVIRDLLGANDKLRSALGRNLGAIGLGSADAYPRAVPVPAASHVMDVPVTDACAPSLRVRLAKITVNEEDDDVANDEVYCSISAQVKDVQELRITPKTKALDEGDSQTFTGDETVVWGQGGPKPAAGDMTLKYDCFETDSSQGYTAFIKAAADAAKKYGTKVVSSDNAGYVSTGADLVSAFLPQILALDSDDHLFKAEQTIPAARQMELAKGATWTLNKSGSHLWSDWDWTLTMESFGCSVNGTK